MSESEHLFRMPIKSADTGDTLALMSASGLLLWSKRKKRWESFDINSLMKMYAEVVKMSGVIVVGKEETA